MNPITPFRQLVEHRMLWKNLLKRRLIQAYHNSVLGWLWSVIQPLFMLLVYSYVFREVFKVRWGSEADTSNSLFAITMFCGLAFFNIFSEAVNASVGVMRANVNFIKKTVFPLELLPLTQSCGCGHSGRHMVPDNCAGKLFYQRQGSLRLGIAGVSADFSSLCAVHLRNLFGGGFIRGLFPGYPIPLHDGVAGAVFHYSDFLPGLGGPGAFRWMLELNPFSWFVDAGRNALLYGVEPETATLLLLMILGSAFWQLGWACFKTTGKGFADVL